MLAIHPRIINFDFNKDMAEDILLLPVSASMKDVVVTHHRKSG